MGRKSYANGNEREVEEPEMQWDMKEEHSLYDKQKERLLNHLCDIFDNVLEPLPPGSSGGRNNIVKKDKKMSRQKIYKTLIPFLFLLISVLLTGCHKQEDFPIYRLETLEDDSELLYIDDVQYHRNWNGNELAKYYSGGDVWTLTEGLGEQIGICGNGADSGGGFSIYEVAGDEERTVLYMKPRKFYFGGQDVRLWLREDVSLGPPTAEMVSSLTIIDDKEQETQSQTDKVTLIESLLDAYQSETNQSVKPPVTDEQWINYTIILHHKDYPFLQYEIRACYVSSQNKAYCRNDALEWFALPEEWSKALAKTD